MNDGLRLERAMRIGERIAQARRRRDMSQRELAEKMGRAASCISLWESGTTSPTATHMQDLCEALQVSADRILGIPAELRDIVHA